MATTFKLSKVIPAIFDATLKPLLKKRADAINRTIEALPQLPPAECADLLFQVREERLRTQKDVDTLEALEKALKEQFIQTLPKSSATGIAGHLARVQVIPKDIPIIQDWDKFYAFVRKNNAFHFLQRRVNESAVKELWEDKKQVPGVGKFNAPSVSCTKL